MKKTVSFCLAVLMLISTLLTANAVQTNNRSSESDYNMFYFLASGTENLNYFSLNDNTEISKDKKYSAGDTVTVTYNIGGIKRFGSLNSVIAYNADILEPDELAFDNGKKVSWFEYNDNSSLVAVNNTSSGIKIGMLTYDPEYGTDYSNNTDIVTIQFKSKTDFNQNELGIELTTKRLMAVGEYDTINLTDSASDYISIKVDLTVNSDTDSDTDTITDTDTETYFDSDDMDSDTPDTDSMDTDTDTDSIDTDSDNTDTDTDSIDTDSDNTNTDTDSMDTDSDNTDTDTDSMDTDSDNQNPTNPVKKLKVGDVDGDGNITSADALLVLRKSVKLETFTDEQITAADVNKDGEINSADALFILRKSVKLTDNGTYFED